VVFIWTCHISLYATSTKIALIIGIGHYGPQTDWADLSSLHDVNLIKTTLLQRGFEARNIYTLADKQATQAGILMQINTKLFERIHANDIVYIHFSGHGQQCMDTDGDEIDGLDECLVPYDSPKNYKQGIYEGQKLITDDVLNKILARIRNKLGKNGQLIVSIDACHSGTGIRSGRTCRGTTQIMASQAYLSKIRTKVANENATLNVDNASKPGLAPITAIFGSAQNQLNYEMKAASGETFGSLSYALSKCLSANYTSLTFRELLTQITVLMSGYAPLQQPQAEGNLDGFVFNNILNENASYVSLVGLKNNQLTINGGFFKGLHEGTKIGLINVTSKDTIWQGTISRATPHVSYADMTEHLLWDEIKGLKCITIEHNFGSTVVDLKIDSFVYKADSLKILLRPKKYIRLVDIAPEIIVSPLDSGISSMILSTSSGIELDTLHLEMIQNVSMVEKKLTTALKKYIQASMLRSLEITDDEINLQFDVVPVSDDLLRTMKDSTVVLAADEDGQKKLPIGSRFQFLITNRGIRPAYFTMIDIQPNQVINILLPSGSYTAEDLRILPDQKILIPIVFETGYPLGNELFKLIGSDKPIDFVTPFYNRKAAMVSPIEKLFHYVDDEDLYQTKGAVGLKNIHVTSQSYIITQK
jgi:hypothetical protein